MTGYSAAEFEAQALAGDWHAAISVLSRATVKQEILEALMVPEAHDEVRLALAMRQDVMPKQLDWIAEHTADTSVLNRTAAHGKTSASTIRNIRSKALEREVEGDTWRHLVDFTTRRLYNLTAASGLHRGL